MGTFRDLEVERLRLDDISGNDLLGDDSTDLVLRAGGIEVANATRFVTHDGVNYQDVFFAANDTATRTHEERTCTTPARPTTSRTLEAYARDLILQQFYYGAMCVLDTLTVHEGTAVHVLYALCAIGLQDMRLLRKHRRFSLPRGLQQLADALCDYDHEAHAVHVKRAIASAVPPRVPPRADVGVVIPAGGARLLTQLIANIHSLRRSGCTLPITVAHARELSHSQRNFLSARYNTDFLDISDIMPPGDWRGFQIKLAVLANVPYGTCILCDADIVWVQDPSRLVAHMRAKEAELLLFSDFWNFERKHHDQTLSTAWLYAMNGAQAKGHESESGVVILHSRAHRVRAALNYMAVHHSYYFRLTYGDKDLFRLAAELAGASVCVMPHLPELLCYQPTSSQSKCGHSMLQYGTGGVSHIHTTLFPVRDGAQLVPFPDSVCATADVVSMTHELHGVTIATFGCAPAAARPLAADCDAMLALRSAIQHVAQGWHPW